jgi:hypothetical protein
MKTVRYHEGFEALLKKAADGTGGRVYAGWLKP